MFYFKDNKNQKIGRFKKKIIVIIKIKLQTNDDVMENNGDNCWWESESQK